MRDVTGVVLGGGRGSRLFPLTQYRSKPAVPIGGKYRLIDIPISNCIHSDVNKVFVLTQFNSASLHRHISATYRFDSFSDGFVEILAAEQTMENTHWYQGTADAVRKQLRRILSRHGRQVLVLSGDHLYRMNYLAFVSEHREHGADVSIAVKPVTREQAPGLGILKRDGQGRVIDFVEKPQTVGVRSIIGAGARVRDSVLMGRMCTSPRPIWSAMQPVESPTSASALAPSSNEPSSTRTPGLAPTSLSRTRRG